MKSAITVSLVEEARGGPFVFWDGVPAACAKARELGFDAIEIFAPGPEHVDTGQLQSLLHEYAYCTMRAFKLREDLRVYTGEDQSEELFRIGARSIIDLGAPFGAFAIIGSMQGRFGNGVDQDTALGWLREALDELGEYAKQYNVPLIYEPLNRYETNLANTVAAGVALCESLATDNVKLLPDLFHMNIEESDLAAALAGGGRHIGHVHFVDSNRRAAGFGHLAYEPIIAALRQIGYDGYLCAEALPLPDSDAAARQTIAAFSRYVSA